MREEVSPKNKKAEREGGQVLIIARGDSAGLSDGPFDGKTFSHPLCQIN